jgi:ribosomal protein S18 acetylase RimI-like enzyme
VTLRPAGPRDRELLHRVYASTRAEELANVPWDDEAKDGFLRAQFDAQDRWWREHYAGASFDVVLVDGEPAGRLYVYASEDEIRIVDIALLPAFRARGIGSVLLAGILAEGRRVTIHVERMNPALRLYERLGFVLAEDRGVYLFLERPAYVNTAS